MWQVVLLLHGERIAVPARVLSLYSPIFDDDFLGTLDGDVTELPLADAPPEAGGLLMRWAMGLLDAAMLRADQLVDLYLCAHAHQTRTSCMSL
jgi:hypothetical protein